MCLKRGDKQTSLESLPLVTERQARLRHASHFVAVAEQHRTDLAELASDFSNILEAGNFCIELDSWRLLTRLTKTINDYLIGTARWDEYIRLNSPLVTHDLSDQPAERISRTNKLIEVEESRMNYSEALRWNKLLLQLQEQVDSSDVNATIEALKKISKLSKTQGQYDEAATYLLQGLSLARNVGYTKDEVDLLFELSLLHLSKRDFERAVHFGDSSLLLARSIGYSVGVINSLMFLASLSSQDNQLERALRSYDQALEIAKRMSDAEREEHIRFEISRLRELIRLEEQKQRKIFISYNHEDRPFVERLATDLKKHGLAVWWDAWEIRVGQPIWQKICEGIDSSAYLIAVLSSSSVKSDWVKREIGSASMKQLSAERNIIVLPLLVNDCEVPALLREIKWADFRKDYGGGLKSLLEVLIGSAK